MIISVDTRLPFPRSLVYATYRDKLVEVVPYLSNVRSLKVKSRYQERDTVYSIYEWHGGGEIPQLARAILSEKMLCWTEYDTWNETEFTLAWRIETHAFTEAVSCLGKNRFLEDDNRTLIKSSGQLTIDSTKIEGFPKFMSKKVAQIVEDFLSKKIQPNLLEMSKGVQHYLENNPN